MLQPTNHLARPLHARGELEILALKVEQSGTQLKQLITRYHPTLGLEPVDLRFGLEAPPAPPRQLIGQVPKHPLEVGERRRVRTNVG